MATKEDFSQSKGVAMWAGHHDELPATMAALNSLKPSRFNWEEQGPGDFLTEELQKEMRVHHSVTTLHSATLHTATGVKLRVPLVLHTKRATRWEESK